MKLLLYCTKGKPYLLQGFSKPMHTKDITNPFNYNWRLIEKQTYNTLNGKIVAECDFEVEEIYPVCYDYYQEDIFYETESLSFDELLEKSCLDNQQIDDYMNADSGYAIHIKNLHIFDEPKELSDYHISYYNKELKMQREKHIEKAPQNMCYVFDINDNYVFISIRPEWLCKILNGEKTIEVRKKVLKEML